ncbi:hypothetical protein ACVW16_001251 [Bradyrhizobium sp. USDA 4474]
MFSTGVQQSDDESDVVRILATPKQPYQEIGQTELRDKPPRTKSRLSNMHEWIQLAKAEIEDHVSSEQIREPKQQDGEHQERFSHITTAQNYLVSEWI